MVVGTWNLELLFGLITDLVLVINDAFDFSLAQRSYRIGKADYLLASVSLKDGGWMIKINVVE